MAQVVLDVLYNVKGMQALQQSQKAMDSAAKATKRTSQQLRDAQGKFVAVGGSARKASAGVKAFGAATVGATGSLRAFGAAMASYLAPVAAIAAAVGGLAKSFQIAGEREADARALANGLEKIGAQKGALDSLQASADKLGKTTLFNQEDFTKGYKLLTSFRNIALNSYEDVITAAADMSTVIGTDVNSSLLQLSKALENPAKGLTYLSRSGTTFTDQQKEMITAMQEAGNVAGAQAEIMKVVQEQYGGAAEAAGKSGLAGAFDSLMETLRDAGEVIGKALEPLAVGAMQAITQGVQFLGDVWNQLATSVFPSVQEALKPIFESLKKIYDAIDWEAVATVVGGVVVGAFKALEFALRPVLFLFEQIFKVVEAIVNSPVGDMLGKAFNFVAEKLFGAGEAAENLKTNVEETVTPVSELTQNLERTPEPIDKAAGKMDELKTKTDAAKGKTAELNAETKKGLAPREFENLALEDQKKILEVIKEKQAAANGEKEVGVTMADLMAQMELLAAQNAQLLAQSQAGANAEISAGANEAGRLADNMQRAASAAGGAGVSRSGKYGTAGAINTVKAVNGEIVRKTQEELRQEKASKRAGGYLGHLFEYDATRQTAASAAFDKNVYDPLVASGNLNRYIGKGMATGGTPLGPDSTSKLYQEFMQQAHGAAYTPQGIPGYAEGGYVTGPQQAVIGEGGEPEYVIPASKMDGAMQRYAAGMRGSSMIPSSADVTVNYSGSTVDMGGTSYINKGDVTGIVSQAVNQTLTKLQRSSKARLTAGLR